MSIILSSCLYRSVLIKWSIVSYTYSRKVLHSIKTERYKKESSTYIILTCIASFPTRLIPTQPDYTFNGRLTAIKAQLGDIWCIGDFNDKNELWASMQVVDPSPVETYSRRENAELLGSHTSPPSLIILCMMCLLKVTVRAYYTFLHIN